MDRRAPVSTASRTANRGCWVERGRNDPQSTPRLQFCSHDQLARSPSKLCFKHPTTDRTPPSCASAGAPGAVRRRAQGRSVVAPGQFERPRQIGTSSRRPAYRDFDETQQSLTSCARILDELVHRGETPVDRLVGGAFDLSWIGSRLRCVENRSGSGREPDTIPRREVDRSQRSHGCVDRDAGELREPSPASAEDREVRAVRNHIGEIEQFERALVGDNRGFLADREPGSDDLLPLERRIVTEAVDATMESHEPAGFRVMCDQTAVESACTCLGGREVAVLLRGNPEEARKVRLSDYRVIHMLKDTVQNDDTFVCGRCRIALSLN